MKFTIISSTQSAEYTITYLEVETSAGNFVILEGHEPMILILKPESPLIFTRALSPDSIEKQLLHYGGILKINRSEAILISNE